jgi:hypothetical protein
MTLKSAIFLVWYGSIKIYEVSNVGVIVSFTDAIFADSGNLRCCLITGAKFSTWPVIDNLISNSFLYAR